MREMVLATIADQPDIEIVGEIQEDGQIFQSVEDKHPDFLVIALEKAEERPSLCDLLLERFPRMKILAVAPEQNLSVFYWASLAIHSDPVEASEQGVLDALHRSPQLAGGEA